MPELLFLESTWNINDRSNGPIHPPTLYPPQKNPVGMSGLHRDTKIWLVEKGKAGRLSLNECSKIRVHRCPWTGLGHFQDTVVAKTGPPEGKQRESPTTFPTTHCHTAYCCCCCCWIAAILSDSVRRRWRPTRLPGPWDSPGKNTGACCHFLLQCTHAC